MLSILIPTYNYSIVNLVNQVHKQAKEAAIVFEIIVVDDFSNDVSIVEQNKKIVNLEYCHYFKNEKNIGRTASRNLLAQKSQYESLLFLDADVLPKRDDFISRFNLNENKEFPVIYGGVCYYDEAPEKDQILRWKYGNKREAKSVSERLKEPYFIISQNLLLKKDIFISTNSVSTHAYGLDILFSNNLKKNNISVKHIDNPVYHLGLESNQSFINKSLEAVETTLRLEENNLLDNNLRPLQKSYRLLKKYRSVGVFNFIIGLIKKSIELNLVSKNPSLFLFDIYRLHYYIRLKAQSNA